MTLSFEIPRSFYKKLQSKIIEFIWGHKPVRLRKNIITRHKESGGLGVPDLYQYYIASHLNRLVDWHWNQEEKQWVNLKKTLSVVSLANSI